MPDNRQRIRGGGVSMPDKVKFTIDGQECLADQE